MSARDRSRGTACWSASSAPRRSMAPVSSLDARPGTREGAARAGHPAAARTSIIIPAFNEAAAIGPLVTELRAVASWHEILVIDDGSVDDTGRQASAAGARVIRHPYNKGNGAAVK